MMHPETVEDWRPGSSDDDWSLIDEPEVQCNKVADEDEKQVGLTVTQATNFSEKGSQTPSKDDHLLGDASKLDPNFVKSESLRMLISPSGQMAPDQPKPAEKTVQAKGELPVSSGIQNAELLSRYHSQPQALHRLMSAFANVSKETGSLHSLNTSESEGDTKLSMQSQTTDGEASAVVSGGQDSGSERSSMTQEQMSESEDSASEAQESQLSESEEEESTDGQEYANSGDETQESELEGDEQLHSEILQQSDSDSEQDSVDRPNRSSLMLPSEVGSGDAVAQLEKDIRAASKPLTVEPPSTTRYHKILVAGQQGCGKSTFIKCVSAAFSDRTIHEDRDKLTSFWEKSTSKNLKLVVEGTLQGAIGKHHFTIEELVNGHTRRDFRAHGSTFLQERAQDHISRCQDHYLRQEQDGNRTQPMSEMMDARVDVCLWFLETPSANDVWSMVQLSTCIPVIPILAKADALTALERSTLHGKVAECMKWEVQRLAKRGLHPVPSPVPALCQGVAPEGIFFVAASTEMDYSINRHGWPIRSYPWGDVEPMASTHSDLLALTHTLFELAPEQLKVATEERFSRYRRQQTSMKKAWPLLQTILRVLCFLSLGMVLLFLNFWFCARVLQSFPTLLPSKHSPIAEPFNPAGSALMYQATATSATISARVDQILQLEPSQDDLRLELPLQALLDTQDSYEQWQNSTLTREYDVGKLIGLIDNLVSSLTYQRTSVKDGLQMKRLHLRSDARANSDFLIGDDSSQEAAFSGSSKCFNGIKQDFEQQTAFLKSELKTKLAREGGKMHKRVRKAAKKMHEAESKLQRQASKLGKKVQSLVRNLNSKRLLRRVLVANFWL